MIDVCRPGVGMARLIGEAGERAAQAVVAGEAKDHAAMFAGFVGDGGDTGLGGELRFGREAFTNAAELGEDLSGADAAGARKRHDDLAVGQVCHGVLNAGGELGELGDQALQDAGERSAQLALGFGLQFAVMPGGGAAQSLEQDGDRPAPA